MKALAATTSEPTTEIDLLMRSGLRLQPRRLRIARPPSAAGRCSGVASVLISTSVVETFWRRADRRCAITAVKIPS